MLQLGQVLSHCHIEEQSFTRMMFNARAKAQPMSTTLYVHGVCAPCTLVQARNWHRLCKQKQSKLNELFTSITARCSKLQDIRFQFPMVEESTILPSQSAPGIIYVDMVEIRCVLALLEAQVRSFRC